MSSSSTTTKRSAYPATDFIDTCLVTTTNHSQQRQQEQQINQRQNEIQTEGNGGEERRRGGKETDDEILSNSHTEVTIIDENTIIGMGMNDGKRKEEQNTIQLMEEEKNVGESSIDARTNIERQVKSVAVIGAGIAGLSAALHLHSNGFTNVTILEASQRAGGRIHTYAIRDGSVTLELGAQWIHGQEGNPLFDYASSHGLLSDHNTEPSDDEKSGLYCTEDGQVINQSLVEAAIGKLDEIKEQLSNDESIERGMSVGEYFHEQFQMFIESMSMTQPGNNVVQNDEIVQSKNEYPRTILWSLYEWYMTFECIDNACGDLKKLSSRGYNEWFDCPGQLLVNFKNGYNSVIETIKQEIPKSWLKLNTQVTKINICPNVSNNENMVQLTIQPSGEVLTFDHVIITMSLGCLKQSIQPGGMLSLLESPMYQGKTYLYNQESSCPEERKSLLSIEKEQAINSLGYGTINKIFLIFDFDYWPADFAVKFVWKSRQKFFGTEKLEESELEENHSTIFPTWVQDISGFDLVRGRKDILLGWIGGHGAEMVETIPDEQVGSICTKLLRQFLPSLPIEEPKETIVTKWFTNPFFRGSYSHRTVDFERIETNLELLQEPIFDPENIPRILFAGEATDREFYSSTHGALRSGIREADRLTNYLKSNN